MTNVDFRISNRKRLVSNCLPVINSRRIDVTSYLIYCAMCTSWIGRFRCSVLLLVSTTVCWRYPWQRIVTINNSVRNFLSWNTRTVNTKIPPKHSPYSKTSKYQNWWITARVVFMYIKNLTPQHQNYDILL